MSIRQKAIIYICDQVACTAKWIRGTYCITTFIMQNHFIGSAYKKKLFFPFLWNDNLLLMLLTTECWIVLGDFNATTVRWWWWVWERSKASGSEWCTAWPKLFIVVFKLWCKEPPSVQSEGCGSHCIGAENPLIYYGKLNVVLLTFQIHIHTHIYVCVCVHGMPKRKLKME